MNIDGSDVTRLTFSVDGDSDPSFSPDGTKIVFSSYRTLSHEIFVMNADGSNVMQLTAHYSQTPPTPVFSPDGTKIAFMSRRSGDSEIMLMNADGTNEVNLTNEPGSDTRPEFSPDGSKIAYNRNGITVMNIDGSNKISINPTGRDPSWSIETAEADSDGAPDFRDNCPTVSNPEKIAFSSARDGYWEIYTINADGSNETRLTNNSVDDGSPTFSPNGAKIAFNSARDGNAEIYMMNADGTDQRRLTNNPALDSNPTISPDGTKIAFVSTRDGNSEIYMMNADGTNQIRLTNNPANDFDPAFSPDGTKIAFVSARDGNWEIYVMDADGSNQINLSNNPALDRSPTFSPDGERIAFTSYRDGNAEIYVMTAMGYSQTRLTNNSGYDIDPAFSPDGLKIVFSSDRVVSGNFDIYVMNADGSNQHYLTNNPVRNQEPVWGRQADRNNNGIGDACDAPPVARCRNVTVMLGANQTAAAAGINDGSYDPEGDSINLTYNPAGPYPVGSTVVTLTVDDGFGASDSCTGMVTVLYQFKFFTYSDLLSNPQYFIQETAGANLAIRFSLSGFKGDPYSQPPTSHQISCSTKVQTGPATVIDRFAPDPYYSSSFDFYQTTWRTQTNWRFTCRRLTLYFKDGTTQTLDFYFK